MVLGGEPLHPSPEHALPDILVIAPHRVADEPDTYMRRPRGPADRFDEETGWMFKDVLGYALSGATATSLPHFETAVRELNLFINDPVATVDKAIAESPDFVMAHALKAWLLLLGTEPAAVPLARAALVTASR